MKRKRIQCLIICGAAKTGTTLPLTLLDNHPELLVFPEELRFFHLGCERENGNEAANRLFSDFNIQNLSKKNQYFESDDYMKHGGTGFGKKDYSNFNYLNFESSVRKCFNNTNDASERFFGLIDAYIKAIGIEESKGNYTFVCKAPHNEVYIEKWKEILGENGKFIITTRLPTEHFLSLKNVNKMSNESYILNVFDYVNDINSRFEFWEKFPSDRSYILDYDLLINDTKSAVVDVCNFLNIKYNDSLLIPTKMGVPWAGNSSRNIVGEKVFKNEHTAHLYLNKTELKTIESGLQEFYIQRNWSRITSIKIFDKLRYIYYYKLKKKSTKLKNSFLVSVPKGFKDFIKNIIGY